MRRQLALWGLFAALFVVATIALNPPRPKKPPAPVAEEPEEAPPPPRRRSRPKPESATRKPTSEETKKEDALLDVASSMESADDERELALDALDAALLEQAQVERLAAVAAMRGLDGAVRRSALEALLAVALEGNELARLRALDVFASIRADAEEERDLADLLSDQNPAVRARAAAALGDVETDGQADALVVLERSFPQEQDAVVQDGIAQAIARAGGERADAILERLSQGASEGTAAILARYRTSLVPAPPVPPPALPAPAVPAAPPPPPPEAPPPPPEEK